MCKVMCVYACIRCLCIEKGLRVGPRVLTRSKPSLSVCSYPNTQPVHTPQRTVRESERERERGGGGGRERERGEGGGGEGGGEREEREGDKVKE